MCSLSIPYGGLIGHNNTEKPFGAVIKITTIHNPKHNFAVEQKLKQKDQHFIMTRNTNKQINK